MITPTNTSLSVWERLPNEIGGVPLWKREDGSCYIATSDTDLLLFIDAALARFDHMSAREFHDFVTYNRHQPAPGSIHA